jgi:serine protease inhibitor ecotin
MKKIVSVVLMAAFLSVSSMAFAAEQKLTGVIEKITVNGGAATVVLKDGKSGAKVEVIVKDQLTVDKLKDKRIVIGDEVRVKYDDANKESKLFRKTAGC